MEGTDMTLTEKRREQCLIGAPPEPGALCKGGRDVTKCRSRVCNGARSPRYSAWVPWTPSSMSPRQGPPELCLGPPGLWLRLPPDGTRGWVGLTLPVSPPSGIMVLQEQMLSV